MSKDVYDVVEAKYNNFDYKSVWSSVESVLGIEIEAHVAIKLHDKLMEAIFMDEEAVLENEDDEIDKAKTQGYEEGEKDAKEEWFNNGYEAGYDQAYADAKEHAVEAVKELFQSNDPSFMRDVVHDAREDFKSDIEMMIEGLQDGSNTPPDVDIWERDRYKRGQRKGGLLINSAWNTPKTELIKRLDNIEYGGPVGGLSSMSEHIDLTKPQAWSATTPKKRGRPAGSRNKPKAC